MKKHTGFTLIELLVVVAIIALLAATILASLGGARTKARVSRAKSEMSSIRSQMEIYYNTHNGFTTGGIVNGCAQGPFDPAGGADNASRLVQGIAQTVNGNATSFYNMYCIADEGSWAVSAVLPDGVLWCVDHNGGSRAGIDSNGNPTTSVAWAITPSPHQCY